MQPTNASKNHATVVMSYEYLDNPFMVGEKIVHYEDAKKQNHMFETLMSFEIKLIISSSDSDMERSESKLPKSFFC